MRLSSNDKYFSIAMEANAENRDCPVIFLGYVLICIRAENIRFYRSSGHRNSQHQTCIQLPLALTKIFLLKEIKDFNRTSVLKISNSVL